jgi:hypothetical protein
MTRSPIQVLLVEDNPIDCRLIRGLLDEHPSQTFSVRCADRLQTAGEQLRSSPADVVLLDLTLPDATGLETFDLVHRQHGHLPIVILTGVEDEILAATAIERGAQDYLLKGQVDRNSLARALRYAIERKRGAEAIHRLNEELEQRVLERTRELTASNRELEAFCRSVAHDLRAPLRAIDGFSRALEPHGQQLDEQGRSYLRRVREATRRMSLMIDAMLKMSSVARCPMRRQRIDLSALAHKVIAELESPGHAPPVEWIVVDGLHTCGDVQLLWMVLENLLDNACKFSRHERYPRVELGSSGPGEFFVRDNGVGFDMAFADKLFTPFERLHGEKFEGIGIGLATTERIVSRHGGRIWAESMPGQGAVFHFTLPDKSGDSTSPRG